MNPESPDAPPKNEEQSGGLWIATLAFLAGVFLSKSSEDKKSAASSLRQHEIPANELPTHPTPEAPLRIIVDKLPPKKRGGWWIAKWIVKGLTLVLLFIVAVLTYNQWHEMSKQNSISQLNFRLQRRPFVGITSLDAQALSSAKTLTTRVKNYGASPARGVFAFGVFKDRVEDWRANTCRLQNKTIDVTTAGPAIFQDTEPQALEITIDPSSVSSPPHPYLAVCITFIDIQGPFHFFDSRTVANASSGLENPKCSPYAIKHLFGVSSEQGLLHFTPIATSVEGAEPELNPEYKCQGE
jgi:hypothetical protein